MRRVPRRVKVPRTAGSLLQRPHRIAAGARHRGVHGWAWRQWQQDLHPVHGRGRGGGLVVGLLVILDDRGEVGQRDDTSPIFERATQLRVHGIPEAVGRPVRDADLHLLHPLEFLYRSADAAKELLWNRALRTSNDTKSLH